MTTRKNTMEERFDKEFGNGFTSLTVSNEKETVIYSKEKLLLFVNSELSELAAAILERKKAHHVRIVDLMEVLKERGIIIKE